MKLVQNFGVKAFLAVLAFLAWIVPAAWMIIAPDTPNIDGALKWSGASILLAKMAFDYFFQGNSGE